MVSKSTKSYIKKITTLETDLTQARSKELLATILTASELAEIDILLANAAPAAATHRCAYARYSSNVTHSVALPIDPKHQHSWGYYHSVKRVQARKDPNLKKISGIIQPKLDDLNLNKIKINYQVRLVSQGYGYSMTDPIISNMSLSLEGKINPTLQEIAGNKATCRFYKKGFIREKQEIDEQLAIINKFLGPEDE